MPTSVSLTRPTRRPPAAPAPDESSTESASGEPANDESARSGTAISSEKAESGPSASVSSARAGEPSAAAPPSSAAVNAPSQRPDARTISSAPGIQPSNIGSTGSVAAVTTAGGRISIRTPLGVDRRTSSVRSSIRIRGDAGRCSVEGRGRCP